MYPISQVRFHTLSLKNMAISCPPPPAYPLQTCVTMDAINAPQAHAPNASTPQTATSPCSTEESATQLVQLAHTKVMREHVPNATLPAPPAQQDPI